MNQQGMKAGFGDQVGIAKTMVNEINKRGGIAGRNLVPVFYDVRAAQGVQNPASEAQAACERWTVDKPVFAAINMQGLEGVSEPLIACMAKRHTPIVSSDRVRPRGVYNRYLPYLFGATQPALERLAPVWVQRLTVIGYFKGGWDIDPAPGAEPTKVGLLTSKEDNGSDFIRVMKSELDKQSLTVASTFEWSGNISRISDEMTQAVVRFRDAGVTHVMPSTRATFYYFNQVAESQRYRPRYGVSSAAGLVDYQGQPRSSQLNGAMGVSWNPNVDVDAKRDPGDVSKEEATCRQIMKSAGHDVSNRKAYSLMTLVCDQWMFLATAIENGGLSREGVLRGAADLGSMETATQFGRVTYTRSEPYAQLPVRDLVYRNDCGCFAYASTKNHAM